MDLEISGCIGAAIGSERSLPVGRTKSQPNRVSQRTLQIPSTSKRSASNQQYQRTSREEEFLPPSRSALRRSRPAVIGSSGCFGALIGQDGLEAGPKDQETLRFLERALAPIFFQFGRATLTSIASTAKPCDLSKGEVLIREGDTVEEDSPGLYILESGALTCYKAKEGMESPGQILKTCVSKGDVVGELAILHRCPRAASVLVEETSRVWWMTRGAVTLAKVRSAQGFRDIYMKLLRKVELFKPLDAEAHGRMVDMLRQEVYNAGEEIVTEGEIGTTFFIIMKGKAVAKRQGYPMKTFKPGHHFGELCLIQETVRSNTVEAAEDTVVAMIDRNTFKNGIHEMDELVRHASSLFLGVVAPADLLDMSDQQTMQEQEMMGEKISVSSHHSARMK